MNAKAVEASSIKQEKALKKKKRRNRIIIAIAAVLLSYGIYLLFKPFKGGMTFGICKVFLELYVQNPRTIRHSTVDDFGNTVRIWFTRIDPFGQYRLEPMQCYFRYATEEDKVKYGNINVVLEKVTVARREIDPKRVERFNNAILGLIENPPDLTLPRPLPDSLKGLQLDTEQFRKPIL